MKPQEHITAKEYRSRVENRSHAADIYGRATRGRRADLGNLYFRSKSEANYARYLQLLKDRGDVLDWEYEPTTFWFERIRRGVRSYTPDFYVRPLVRHAGYVQEAQGYYVEVKPYLDPKSQTKLRRMGKYYPHVDVRIVGRVQLKEIADNVGKLIAGWEW